MAKMLGFEPGPPRYTCDGCGTVVYCDAGRGRVPPTWWLKGCPPGWRKIPKDDFTSWHFCKLCKAAHLRR